MCERGVRGEWGVSECVCVFVCVCVCGFSFGFQA